MKPYGIIYKATNKYNMFVYIGQTIKPLQKRKNEHRNSAKRNEGYKFHSAIKDYGWESFSWEILDVCYSAYDLYMIETYYINLYQSHIVGYNQNTWGNIPDEDTRKKISKANKGLKRSKETCLNISLNHTDVKGEKNPNFGNTGNKCCWYGKKHKQETLKKISDTHKGKNNPMYGLSGKLSPTYGRKHTEEEKEKMRKYIFSDKHRRNLSDSHKGKLLSEETKQKISIAKRKENV